MSEMRYEAWLIHASCKYHELYHKLHHECQRCNMSHRNISCVTKLHELYYELHHKSQRCDMSNDSFMRHVNIINSITNSITNVSNASHDSFMRHINITNSITNSIINFITKSFTNSFRRDSRHECKDFYVTHLYTWVKLGHDLFTRHIDITNFITNSITNVTDETQLGTVKHREWYFLNMTNSGKSYDSSVTLSINDETWYQTWFLGKDEYHEWHLLNITNSITHSITNVRDEIQLVKLKCHEWYILNITNSTLPLKPTRITRGYNWILRMTSSKISRTVCSLSNQHVWFVGKVESQRWDIVHG